MTALGDRERWSAAQVPVPWQDITGPTAGGPFAEHDTLGRKVPHRWGLPAYLVWILRLDPERVRRVPAAAIAEESAEAEEALVSCPCGAHPVAGVRLEKCPDCERYYVCVGLGQVYVAYGAMAPPELR